MQIFELYFNPNADKDRVFDTFVYEPENLYEKRLGSLYMAGELAKPLLRNPKFLGELSFVLKDEYYSTKLKDSPEAGLKEAFRRANDFLDAEAKKGNVGWLGNLNFAVINYSDFIVNFTKTGGIKIILIRQGEFLDIGENLEEQSDHAYHFKVFGNVASGKLAPGDKLIVLTKNAFSFFSKNGGFLQDLDRAEDEKSLKEAIKKNKVLFSETSGICLIMMAAREIQSSRALTFKKQLPTFSFKASLFQPLTSLLFRLSLPKPNTPQIKIPPFFLKISKLRELRREAKKLFLVAAMILFLILSFLVFKR